MNRLLWAVLIVAGSGILFISQDRQAADYGNGMLFRSKSLIHGTALQKINGIWITYEAGLGLIVPGESFQTKSGDFYQIKQILAYAMHQNELFFEVEIAEMGSAFFRFDNQGAIFERNPIISNSPTHPSLDWTRLDHPPFLYYYWRLLGPILCITGLGLAVFCLIRKGK